MRIPQFHTKTCCSLTVSSWLWCVLCLTSSLLGPPSADFQEELARGSHKACTLLIWSNCSPPGCPRLTSVCPAAVDQKNSSCRTEAQSAESHLGAGGSAGRHRPESVQLWAQPRSSCQELIREQRTGTQKDKCLSAPAGPGQQTPPLCKPITPGTPHLAAWCRTDHWAAQPHASWILGPLSRPAPGLSPELQTHLGC